MSFTTKASIPLVSATKFDVSPVIVADETGYTGVVGAGSARCVAYASMPKGRALLVLVNVGALSGSPTGIQVGLGVNDDANGTGLAFVSGTTTDLGAAVAGTQFAVEIPLSYVSDSSKFYSACVAVKGGGTTTALIGTTTLVLNDSYL